MIAVAWRPRSALSRPASSRSQARTARRPVPGPRPLGRPGANCGGRHPEAGDETRAPEGRSRACGATREESPASGVEGAFDRPNRRHRSDSSAPSSTVGEARQPAAVPSEPLQQRVSCSCPPSHEDAVLLGCLQLPHGAELLRGKPHRIRAHECDRLGKAG